MCESCARGKASVSEENPGARSEEGNRQKPRERVPKKHPVWFLRFVTGICERGVDNDGFALVRYKRNDVVCV